MKRRLEENTSILPPTKFPRRPGTDDLGRDYEIKMTALLSLRCISMKDTKDMWIGSNVDKVGDFDDIVLYKENFEGTCVAYMMQLKHQENPKNLAPHEFTYSRQGKQGKVKKSKEDFSLSKYSTGYLELKEQLANPTEDEFDVVKQLRKANLIFIIYTNKGVNSCEYLECVSDASLNFLNTSNDTNCAYKFNHSKLAYDVDFLQRLLLFTNQIHVNEVDNLIKKEIKQLMGSSSLTNIDFNQITNKFVAFIKTWIKDTGVDAEKDNFKIYDTLTKNDVIDKLTELILKPFSLDLSKQLFKFYDCQQKCIWNEIVRHKSITIVDADDVVVLAFLNEYIGSEIRNYCNKVVRIWGEDLPKKIENLFYKEHPQFKSEMLKIVGGCQNITMLDIYKCLWFQRKLPLLLEINNKDDIKSIRKILKLSNYSLAVVVINKVGEPANIHDIPQHFVSLHNLDKEDMVGILNMTVKMQGRSSIILGSIVDKSMHECIKCRDIIDILLDNFNIGGEYESLATNFIPRFLSRVFFEPKALKQVEDDTFLLHNINGENFESVMSDPLEDLLYDCKRPKVIFADEQMDVQVRELTKQRKNFHQLRYYTDRFFKLEKSFGSTINIRQHQVLDPQRLCEELKISNNVWKLPQDINYFWTDLEEVVKNDLLKTHLINANPGMGKTVLLDFIATHAPANLWVIKINLNDHYRYYDGLKRRNGSPTAHEHLKYFNTTVVEKYTCRNLQLAEYAFQKMLKQKNIVVLLDGFDEISISYNHEVTAIAKCLHDEGYPVWITSRPVMKAHLESVFDILSNTLRPFCFDDQKKYLMSFFMKLGSTSASGFVEEFTEQLLQAARTNLKFTDFQFNSVPLQIKLLGNVFGNEFKTSLNSNTINFTHKFDLLYLYKEFLNEKNNILCDKFGVGVKDMHIFFEKHQQLFALKTLFSKDDLHLLNIDEQLSEYYEDKQQKIQFLQREGVVIVEQTGTGTVQKLNVNFAHRTFAEYLAAQWLSQNFDTRHEGTRQTVQTLIENRFYDFNHFLYNAFDRIVIKDCPLHLAVINKRINEAKELLKLNPDSVNKIDTTGRTILHIIALYGIRHEELQYCRGVKQIKDDLTDLIEEIPCDRINDIKDEILGYTAFNFALFYRSLAVADKICEKSSKLTIQVDLNDKDDIFTYCNVLQYKSLFKVLLPYFASKDLFYSRDCDESTTLESYCVLENSTISNENIHSYASEFGVTTILELFQVNGCFDDLHFASAFGTEDNVRKLISKGADVNKPDTDYNTPLHYAVIHGRPNIVEVLLESKANVNELGIKGNSALHYSAEYGYDDIMEQLLLKGADINQQNNEDDTPLSVALLNDNIDIAMLLISKDALGNVRNDEGCTCLHHAVEKGNVELVSALLSNVPNVSEFINTQNIEDQTALHCLITATSQNEDIDLENQKQVVQLLLDKGADVNIQDSTGNTPLHIAIRDHTIGREININNLKEFYNFVVISLLDRGPNMDIKNGKGNTVLDQAIGRNNSEVVALLQQKISTMAI